VLSLRGLPLPPTCVFVTVIQAQSYVASRIRHIAQNMLLQQNNSENKHPCYVAYPESSAHSSYLPCQRKHNSIKLCFVYIVTDINIRVFSCLHNLEMIVYYYTFCCFLGNCKYCLCNLTFVQKYVSCEVYWPRPYNPQCP
jgi:hypothetical protein